MSTETFHKIRQLDNGDFICTTTCSSDDCPPHEWTMDYFRKAYPTLSNEQRKAAFILQGLYSGDKFYPEHYKRMQKLGWEYAKAKFAETGEYPYDAVVCGVPMSRERYEREVEQLKKNPSGYIPDVFRKNPERTYEDYAADTKAKLLEAINGFISYMEQHKPEAPIKARIRLNNGDYVAKLTMNSRRIAITPYEQKAQVFHKAKSDIKALMRRIPERCGAQLIILY